MLHKLPSEIYASFNPDENVGDFEFRSEPPASHQQDDALSIDPLHLDTVSPDPKASPLVLDGQIEHITPRLSGRIRAAQVDGKPGQDLAELRVDACTDEDGEDRCDGTDPYFDGVDEITLNARNSLIGDVLPKVAPQSGDPAAHLTFVSRDENPDDTVPAQFRAEGVIPDFREALYSRLDPESGVVVPSTRLRVGFGDGTPTQRVRAFVDRNDSRDELIADAILQEAPRAVGLCLRDPLKTGEAVNPESDIWCERQAAGVAAVQAGLDQHSSGVRPDIDVRRLLIGNSARTKLLTGAVRVDNLGDRVNVISTPDGGEDGAGSGSCSDGEDNGGDTHVDAADADCKRGGPDVLVEGRTITDDPSEDGDLANVAGRIGVELQNYLDDTNPARFGAPSGANGFPWSELEAPMRDPETEEDRNDSLASGDDPGGTNFAKLTTDPQGRFHVKASVPGIRRLGIAPRPCLDDAGRYPDQQAFSANRIPTYRCVRATFAQGKPFGLAVRTLDDKDNVLAVEEGHVQEMPAGDGGFEATLAASPAAASQDPICGDDPDPNDGVNTIVAPPACRPRMVALETDRTDAQSADNVRVEARLITGPLDLLGPLKGRLPRDEASRRLDYERPAYEWGDMAGPGGDVPVRGARVKIGTEAATSTTESRSALRAVFNLVLPRFLDLYPVTAWSCKHKDSPQPETCDALGVSSKNNTGLESQDIFLRLIGAETGHDGVGVDYLGRVAALVTPVRGSGTQLVLTGAPDPDGRVPFDPDRHQSSGGSNDPNDNKVTGASSYSPENLHTVPDNDPSLRGALLPGHLDVRVQLRNDYDSDRDFTIDGVLFGDSRNQQQYAQVDGRVNKPMSLGVRVNDELKPTRSPALIGGDPDAGHVVSDVNLSAYNLPGSVNAADDFVQPTFRIRSELRPTFDGKSYASLALDLRKILSGRKDGLKQLDEYIRTGDMKSFVYLEPAFSLPDPGWLDIKLNADPDGPGGQPPARTVDAVAGPFGLVNNAELRAFQQVCRVNGCGTGRFNKGDPARFTPQAALRLTDLGAGVKGGVSALGLVGIEARLLYLLDFVLGVSGDQSHRTRVSEFLTALKLADGRFADPGSGPSRVDVDARAELALQIVLVAGWGLFEKKLVDLRLLDSDVPVDFHDCDSGLGMFFAKSQNTFQTQGPNAIRNAGLALPTSVSVNSVGDAVVDIVTVIAGLATKVIMPLTCAVNIFMPFIDPNDDKGLVDAQHPAPRYRVDGRPVADMERADPQNPDNPEEADDPEPSEDRTVTEDETLCGAMSVRHLRVKAGGTIRVGTQGTEDDFGAPCDGSLSITAETVVVEPASPGPMSLPAGRILASANRTSLGQGAGQRGSGAGHAGQGGRSGEGSAAGGGTYDAPANDPNSVGDGPGGDFGSRGGTGFNNLQPGRGGGTLVIAASEHIVIDGEVRAEGGHVSGVALDDCDLLNGGGGSGGHIKLSGLMVKGSGFVSARGGNGGPGGMGGGGGGGGRITVESITSERPSLTVARGVGGASDCGTPGLNGVSGDISSRVLQRAAFVTLDESNEGPFTRGEAPFVGDHRVIKLDLRGIQADAGPMSVVLCRREVIDDDVSKAADITALTADALDAIPENDTDPTPARLVQGASCRTVTLGSRNVDSDGDGTTDQYRATLNEAVETGRTYGWYAFAAKQLTTVACHVSPAFCQLQPVLPTESTAKLGIDTDAPEISNPPADPPVYFATNATEACPDDSVCLNSNEGQFATNVRDGLAGVNSVQCSIDGGPLSDDCGDADARTVELSGQGLHTVGLRMEDQLGNAATAEVARFFVDTVKPGPTVVSLSNEPKLNGWQRTKPTVSVTSREARPSSGFGDNPITFIADGVETQCGNAVAGPDAGGNALTSTCDVDAAKVPGSEGVHQMTARARDRAGNVGALAPVRTIRIDATPPRSEGAVGPTKPDGENGWYVTRPFVAFAAFDGAGGSGVDRTKDVGGVAGTGIFWNLDGGAFRPYDPEAETANAIPEGEHSICWYAVDVAGNKEDGGVPNATAQGDNPANCIGPIKVDTVAPVVTGAINPAAPDGANSFYKTRPTASATPVDPQGAEVNRVSGMDVFQAEVDSGGFTGTTSIAVAEGRHEIRHRAVDAAGNRSEVIERVVRVDLSDPAVKLGSFPPAPGPRGWYRRPVTDSVSVTDGRDGSGPDGATMIIDGEGPASYLAPFTLGDGRHIVSVTPRDVSGRSGPTVSALTAIDLGIPYSSPAGVSGSVLLSLLTGTSATLKFTTSDALSPKVKVRVHVYDTLGKLVRRLAASGDANGFRAPGAGNVVWDGHNDADKGVLPGLYHFRVQVSDMAGNTFLSTESGPILVLLGVLPQ